MATTADIIEEAARRGAREAERRLLPIIEVLAKRLNALEQSLATQRSAPMVQVSVNPPPVRGPCYRCGRKGHWASSCYAKTDVRGNELESDDSDYNSE